jgi:hypothetical protein
MAGRIRTIKPEVLEDEIANGLTDASWRLWVSLWVLADDHGNVRLGDRYVAASVWQDTSRDVAAPRDELVRAGLVTPYAVNGQRYGHIVGWEKHQRVDNAGKPRVPGPEQDDGTGDQVVGARFAANLGESPQSSGTLGGLPLARRARAQSSRGTTDHRPPTTTADQRTPASGELVAEGKGKKRPGSAAGTRIASDWRPTGPTLDAFSGEGVDAAACVAEFVDYWTSVPGPKGLKADWEAAFRNWVRRLQRDGRAPAIPPARLRPVPPAPEDTLDAGQERKPVELPVLQVRRA